MDNHRLLTVIKAYLMAKGYEVYCDHNPHFFIAAIFGGHHEVNFIDQSGKIELWIDDDDIDGITLEMPNTTGDRTALSLVSQFMDRADAFIRIYY